ncbi:MAG: nucleotidyltransferase domain-containing protein [Cyanobacteria bacterium]|nr:nucleotidyltransferase domain-containing protein [Cyanobacteriota bacterium]MDW8200962.1 nucleotidyltransferase domain-containing protein [Cyanobacteriota bacterium SKYGB_h_bin112]
MTSVSNAVVDDDLRETIAQIAQVVASPYPMVFATLSGDHLYGFPSPNSAYDVRGAYILPVSAVVGLEVANESISAVRQANATTASLVINVDLHDLKKFSLLLLKKNGAALEHLCSPLILYTTPHHDRLRAIVPKCITRHHLYHYAGLASTYWHMFQQPPHQIKPLLYAYRALLTGIHLMRSGTINTNLNSLNQDFQLSYLSDLIASKVTGSDDIALTHADVPFHHGEYQRLQRLLEDASQASALPEVPTAKADLHQLLVQLRTGAGSF